MAYSFILLLIQYAYSLQLFVDEFNKNNDVVPECEFGRKEGCKSIALLAKVNSNDNHVQPLFTRLEIYMYMYMYVYMYMCRWL